MTAARVSPPARPCASRPRGAARSAQTAQRFPLWLLSFLLAGACAAKPDLSGWPDAVASCDSGPACELAPECPGGPDVVATDDAQGQPDDGQAQPDDGLVQPDDGQVQPDDGLVQPDDGQAQPDDGLVQPDDGLVQPDDGQAQPDDGQAQPDDGLVQPDDGQGQPDDGVCPPPDWVCPPPDVEPTLLEPGEPCCFASQCASGLCAAAPDGARYCVTADEPCAAPGGAGLAAGEGLCFEGDALACLLDGTFAFADCARDCGLFLPVDACADGECAACSTQCTGHAACVASAYCDAQGDCVPRAPLGAPCVADEQCVDGICLPDPLGQGVCTPSGSDCADGLGAGLLVGQTTCLEGETLARCELGGTFALTACSAAPPCEASRCDAALGDCAAPPPGTPCTPGQSGGDPDTGPWPGACFSGGCVTLPQPLPAGFLWALATSEPVAVPGGCEIGPWPCTASGPQFPWPPDTGQRRCYDEAGAALPECPGQPDDPACGGEPLCGQDAQYGFDVSNPDWNARRFVLQPGPAGQEDQSVWRDEWTGLDWQNRNLPRAQSWPAALFYCQGLQYGGYDDWRLPDRFELQGVLRYGQGSPSWVFDEVDYVFWTSSSLASDWTMAWNVQSIDGFVMHANPKFALPNERVLTRCVRGGTPWIDPRLRFFVSAPDGPDAFVYDSWTGLLWQRTATQGRSWREALSTCASLPNDGALRWRLPNVLELSSLVDPTRFHPPLDPVAFPNTPADWYWSSTSYGASVSSAFVVPFGPAGLGYGHGEVLAVPPSGTYAARCVALGPEAAPVLPEQRVPPRPPRAPAGGARDR